DKSDYQPATVFTAAMNRIESVPFVKFNAGDTANAWQAALPVALTWLWHQLAPPDLRVLFPVRAQTFDSTTLTVRPVKSHPRYGACKNVSRPSPALLPCRSPAPGHQQPKLVLGKPATRA